MKKVRQKIKLFQKKTICQYRMFCRVLKVQHRRILLTYIKEKKVLSKKLRIIFSVISKRLKKNIFKANICRNLVVFKGLKQMSFKLLVLTLMVGLGSVGLAGIGDTKGYFYDSEISPENSFKMGAVDFSLSVSDWQAATTSISMQPEQSTKQEVTIDPLNSNLFKYYATSTNIVGDKDFCEGLIVTATLAGKEMYKGPLTGLLTIATSTLATWEFSYSTETEDFQNSVCDFDIEYKGWQTRHDYPTYENGGFNDTEKYSNHLASWGFRINKVYYDVKTPERGEEGANEWVEIYNQTGTSTDISGWQICDNTSCDTLPTSSPIIIPAQNYAVIVATSTTATSTTVFNGLPSYWYLPGEVTEINIDSLIGNGLANDADMLILKRPDGVIVDQMNWGTPLITWANYNENVWNPGAIDVAEGNVLARVPSGLDTDTPADWVELQPPTVDLIYPDEGGSYTWYWTYSYNITWSAINNNDANADLNISIFYIMDDNHDNIIDAGDSIHTITENTANDGLYNWTVPSGFLGYIWIQLVATGPENPMLNSGTISGKIYDPMPILIGPENIVEPDLPEEDIQETTEDTTPVEEESADSDTATDEVTEEVDDEVVIVDEAPEEIIDENIAEESVIEEEIVVPEEPVIEPVDQPTPETVTVETEPVTS